MLRISPTSPDGIINRSGALFNSGRYEEAYEGIKRFKFDETNEKFKGFALAIIKVRIEDYAAAMSLEKENKKVIDLLNDNEKILTLFKTSQLEKKNLDTLLVAQLK